MSLISSEHEEDTYCIENHIYIYSDDIKHLIEHVVAIQCYDGCFVYFISLLFAGWGDMRCRNGFNNET